MINQKIKPIVICVFLLLIIVVLFASIRNYLFEIELNKNGKVTYGKIDSIQRFPKRSYIHLSYYINHVKYNSFESAAKKEITKNDIGNFYKIKYLESSPKVIRGEYDKKIKDTILLLKLGFYKQDFK